MDGIILDTNIISELRKPRPNKGCTEWFLRQDLHTLYLTMITMAEIAQGIYMHPDDANRDHLLTWFEDDLPQKFAGRILTLDDDAAHAYGRMAGQLRQKKLNFPILDALIAAIAHANNFAIATRNKRDFEGFGLKIIDPFT